MNQLCFCQLALFLLSVPVIASGQTISSNRGGPFRQRWSGRRDSSHVTEARMRDADRFR